MNTETEKMNNEKKILAEFTPTVRKYVKLMKDNPNTYSDDYGIIVITDKQQAYRGKSFQYATKQAILELVDKGVLVKIPVIVKRGDNYETVENYVAYPNEEVMAKAKRVTLEMRIRELQRDKKLAQIENNEFDRVSGLLDKDTSKVIYKIEQYSQNPDEPERWHGFEKYADTDYDDLSTALTILDKLKKGTQEVEMYNNSKVFRILKVTHTDTIIKVIKGIK